MSKRKDAAIRPPKNGEWIIRHATTEAAHGWDNLCTQIPGVLATLFDKLTSDPRTIDNIDRQGLLKGQLAVTTVNGSQFPQWQYELPGGGRIWYVIDDQKRTVWLTKVTARHPNETK